MDCARDIALLAKPPDPPSRSILVSRGTGLVRECADLLSKLLQVPWTPSRNFNFRWLLGLEYRKQKYKRFSGTSRFYTLDLCLPLFFLETGM